MSLFKQSISAAELGELFWEQLREWPTKHKEEFTQMFGHCLYATEEIDKEKLHQQENTLIIGVDDILDEIVYFLSFGIDFALFSI